MKIIRLVNSLKDCFVDDEDYDRVSIYKWMVVGKCCIASVEKTSNGQKYLLSKFVQNNFSIKYDHKDLNPFNNQKSNLRACTDSQNGANRAKQFSLTNTSKYKGVSWEARRKHWIANIMIDRKRIYLGSYSDQESAAEAYNIGALKYFGEFAFLNEIPKPTL